MNAKFRFKAAEIGVFSDKNSDNAVAKFEKGCRIIGLTNGEFSLIDLIYSLLKHTGPARLIVATWSAGIKDAHQVRWMADSNLITDFKLLTDHSYKTRQAKYCASIEELFGIENIRTTEMHAKFALIENDNFKIAIRSSMNLNANRTCELFELDEGNQVFDFLQNYVIHTFENMEPGFIGDASDVMKSVKSFFSKNHESNKSNWWDLNIGKHE